MALRRSSRFGFPPPTPPASTYTVRMVPLSLGVHLEAPWPLLPPGSVVSMTNYLPLGGTLVPRSALSSINTIRSLNSIYGMTPNYTATGAATSIWLSDGTRHAQMESNGSISVASFVSANGIGVAGIAAAASHWQYAPVYSPARDENVLVTAPGTSSHNTLQMVYHATVGGGGALQYSYISGAPRASCVGTFDNYVIAFGIHSGSAEFPTRVQWCQRGDPSAWTQEGSGFEDLVEMRGDGVRVLGANDGRVILFSSAEVWYGLPATYPAQFQFYPLDRTIGCIAPMTVCDTEHGIIFLGSDWALRLLPKGGGASQVLSEPMRKALSGFAPGVAKNRSWGMYDPTRQLYYLYLDTTFAADPGRAMVVNVATGEWGYLNHTFTPFPRIGTLFLAPTNAAIANHLFFGNSNGTVYCENSNLSLENGVAVSAVWRSAPIAADLPGNWKQMTAVHLDYRSTSSATLTLKVSTNGGNTYETTGRTVALDRAPVSGRVESQMYLGGAFPAIELTSTSTGYELHRIDATLNVGGRR